MRLGHYEIQEELGRGGMGVVYRARDARSGAQVALKVISGPAAADERAVERFEREAHLAAAIRHENVARILDVGAEGEARFMAFELLEGGNLAERVKKGGPLPWREAVRHAASVARGLAALHAAGIVHRDVKPANVLVDAAGNAKLADLGLARTPASRDLTATGEVVGTLEYLSPEQADGRRVVDASADLYGLGALLYALLTGEPPFRGTGYGALMKILTEQPSSPRQRAPEVPPRVSRLVVRLLAKDPGARGESAASVARELDALLAPRRALAIAVFLAFLASAGVGAALAFHFSVPPPRPPVAPPPPPRPVPARAAARLTATLGAPRMCASGAVDAVAFVDETHAVSASGDDVVAFWDLDRRERTGTLEDPGPVKTLAVSGDLLLTGGADGHARLWGARDGRDICLLDLRSPVESVAFVPGGRLAVAATRAGLLYVIELDKREATRFFTADSPLKRVVALSGERVIWACEDQTVSLVRVADGVLLQKFDDDFLPQALAVSPDEKTLIVGDREGWVRLWRIGEEAPPRKVQLFGRWGPLAAAFLAGGKQAIVTSCDPCLTVRILDVERLELVRELSGHTGVEIAGVALSPSGARALTCSSDTSLALRRTDTWEEIGAAPGHRGAVTHLAVSADGALGVSAGRDRAMRIWNPRSLELGTGWTEGNIYTGLELLGGHDALWSVGGGKIVHHDFATNAHRVLADFGCVGQELPIASGPGVVFEVHDGKLGKLDLGTGEPLASAEGFEGPTGLAAAKGGRFAIATLRDGRLAVYDAQSGRVGHVPAHRGGAFSIVALGDGGIATGGADGAIQLWDVASGRPEIRRTLAGHSGPVRGLGVSGTLLVSASDDGTVRLWKATGECLETIPIAGDVPCSVALDALGALFVGTKRGVIRRYAIERQ